MARANLDAAVLQPRCPPPVMSGGPGEAYLSNVNLRAVLTVLVVRLGGEATIGNDELYDAMMPGSGLIERFVVEEVLGGIRVSVSDSYKADGE